MSKLLRIPSIVLISSFLVAFALPAAAQPVPPAQVSPAAPASAGDNEDMNAEPQETFGTETLNDLILGLDSLRMQVQAFVANYADLTETLAWFDRQSTNPRYADHWNAIGNDMVTVVGAAVVVALLLELLLYPARRSLKRRRPPEFSGRLTTAAALLGLRFLPVLIFVVLSLSLLDGNAEPRIVHFVILNVVYALTLSRLLTMASRFFLAPHTGALRLIPASEAQALYAHRWLRIFGKVMIYGYFLVDVARAVHVPAGAINAFADLLGFALVVMTIIVILKKRASISTHLRGRPVPHAEQTLWQSMRLWFARRWHILAIAYLIIGYIITAFGVEDGFGIMLRGTILTLLILILMRLLFHAVNRWGAADAADGLHHALLRFLFRLVIWCAAILAAAAGWGADIPALFATPLGQRIRGAGFSIGITIVVVTLVYEIFSALIERHLARTDASGEKLRASARTRTLLPMLRNTAFIVLAIIVGLVVLSAAGVNIGPLLAGAGVVGVAIGFGSQSLVKDFITGLFIVLENVIAVGDLVRISDYTGNVEAISIRTIRIRDENGALHILPFSEVSKITNMTRDYVYAMADVGVANDTDLEHAMDIIRAVGRDLQKDKTIGKLILEPVEVLGVETLGDFSITLRARLRVRPGMQREVRRMFLLRLKQRFDKEGIEIPFPTAVRIEKGSA